MVIVFVIDNYLHQTNGTTITTKRFIENLKLRGHEVRVISTGSGIDNIYTLEERHIPIVSWFARKQDVVFSKPDIEVIEKAIEGADIIHLVTPFKTSRVVRDMAQKKGIATTASFHIQPENITYGAGLHHFGFLNAVIYNKFRKFYDKISYVHAPSKFIAQELKKHYYPNAIKVISNGVSDRFFDAKTDEDKTFFNIVSTGRYAKEKNQITLLKAINQSSYKARIRLILPGQGPKEDCLKRYAKKHQLNVEFGFKNQENLIASLKQASLYVHPANIEIEAIACLEAIAVGLVPLIANSKKSATPQFALDDRNLFKPNDVTDLKNKIEYWIEHEEERQTAKENYASYAEKFRLNHSIDRFEEMLKEAIIEKKGTKLANTVKGKVFAKSLKIGPVMRPISAMTYYLIAIPVLYLYMTFFLNVRYKHAGNLHRIKGGAILISNHVHILDSAMNSLAAFPRRPIMTSQKDNFDKPVAGFFVNLLGAVPIPTDLLETQVFFNQMSKYARKGRLIHMFPEGELIDKDLNVRSFKRGAFKLAVESSVPVVPIRISFKEYKVLLWKRRQIILNVGHPLYPDLSISSKDALEKLKRDAEIIMNDLQ